MTSGCGLGFQECLPHSLTSSIEAGGGTYGPLQPMGPQQVSSRASSTRAPSGTKEANKHKPYGLSLLAALAAEVAKGLLFCLGTSTGKMP